MRLHLFAIVCLLLSYVADASSITDLSTWTLLQDPPYPLMPGPFLDPPPPGTTGLAVGGDAALTAIGPVPSGTDIGYASVNGADVSSSSAGYYFDPSADFSVAVDFIQFASNSIGGTGIGFGIGEDVAGEDSIGVALGIVNGAAVGFVAGWRVNDVEQLGTGLVPGFSAGRFFVEYRSATGDVTVGVNATPGASAPSVHATIEGAQLRWDNEPLLVSFFLRSEGFGPIPALASGGVSAVFSNFAVLSGTPITIPEPTSVALASLALLASWRFPRRR